MLVRRLPFQLLVHRVHVDLVVVHGVQGGRGRRRHPRGGGAGLRLTDLLLDHVGHQVGHRPHALADLRAAGEPGGQADVDVLVLVGLNPLGALHRALADHRPGLHRGVDLVAGAVQEAGVDEHHPVGGRLDAGLEVDGGAPLLVHDPDLERVLRQPEHVLDPAEQLDGERHLVGAVHLRLHDVDRAGAAVDQRPVAVALLQPVHGDQAGEQARPGCPRTPRCRRRRRRSRRWSSGGRRCARTAGCARAGSARRRPRRAV